MIRRVAAALLLVALAACSAQSVGIGPQIPGFSPAHVAAAAAGRHRKRVKAYARIVIPVRRRRHRHRRGRPKFVSSATMGVEIAAQAIPSGQTITTVAGLTPGSPSCTTHGSSRTCTVSALVYSGQNQVTVTTYDQAPSGGSFPSTAHELGYGSVAQNVISGVTPYIVVFLGGVIASIGGGPAYSTLPADGSTHTAAFVVAPTDFGNQPISAGSNDPFANPITATLTETGGNGHAQLVFDGVASGASSVTLRHSTDTLALQYDGGGSPGYSAAVALSATGAATQSARVSPMFVTAPTVISHVLSLNGTISDPTLAVAEANAPSTQGYTVAIDGNCSGIATPSSVSGSGSAATFRVAGGSTASASGCALIVTDSLSTALVLPVTNTLVSGQVTLGGVQITEYAVGAIPGPMTLGSDGNLWFINGGETGHQITALRPTTSAPTLGSTYTISGSSLWDITTGDDGALWLTDQSNGEALDRVTTSGAVTIYTSSGASPLGVTSDSNGLLWWTDLGGHLWNATLGGFSSETSASPGSPGRIVQGPDGALWFTDATDIDRWDGTTLTQIPLAAGEAANNIATVPSDNAIWFTASGSDGSIGRIAMNGSTGPWSATTVATLAAGSIPEGIVAGTDNAVWYADDALDKIGRISLAAGNAATAYSVPTTTSGPNFIVRGPDGTLWFTECSANNIGHVIP
jgi:virginiamycin B lyase